MARASFRDLDFIMRSVNFQAGHSNRGGSLDLHADLVRTQPCLRPFDELQIECDGTLMPCCELRSDHADHRPHRIGRLRPGDSLMEAWAGEGYLAWRKAPFSFAPKQFPCRTCVNPSLPDTQDTRRMVGRYRVQLGLDPVRPPADMEPVG